MTPLQQWIKTAVYLLPALVLLATAASHWTMLAGSAWGLLLLAAPCVVLAAFHHRVGLSLRFKTPLILLTEAVLLSAAAWLVYRHGLEKPTFLVEGFSAFFLSLSALALAMHKRRPFSVADVE